MTIDEATVKELEEKYLDAKRQLDKVNAKRLRDEKANKIFGKEFGLDRVNDDYSVYWEEYYEQMMFRFRESFSDDKESNKQSLEYLRKEYIAWMESDLNTLTEILNRIKQQESDL